MTKSDLINRLSQKVNVPSARAESIVDAIFGAIETTLRHGQRIEIRGFGSFELRQYGAYSGRNPRTGTKVAVRPKRLPFFKVGKDLKERINRSVAAAQARNSTLPLHTPAEPIEDAGAESAQAAIAP
ncbi:MAG TPA: HU family DNA-binding protein [Polyangia bacterium]|jgi:integration host factor subunit beta|nr:HU family DNA-binding protein [Polyangia bacterium]